MEYKKRQDGTEYIEKRMCVKCAVSMIKEKKYDNKGYWRYPKSVGKYIECLCEKHPDLDGLAGVFKLPTGEIATKL